MKPSRAANRRSSEPRLRRTSDKFDSIGNGTRIGAPSDVSTTCAPATDEAFAGKTTWSQRPSSEAQTGRRSKGRGCGGM